MFFDQFLERFRPNPGNQRLQKSIKNKQLASDDKEISEQSLLQASNDFHTKNELNQALDEIDKAIQSKSATNQQLLLRAQILIRKEKFNKAREALKLLTNIRKDPQLSIKARNLLKILPQLQLLASAKKLKSLDEAVSIWKDLTRSQEEYISKKASELISQSISKEAKQISAKKSPKEALLFFFQQHLKHSVAPTINEDIKEILKQLEPPDSHFSDPELQQHQLQLMFNMQLVECLETQLRQQGRLGATSEVKKLGAIRETAPNAG